MLDQGTLVRLSDRLRQVRSELLRLEETSAEATKTVELDQTRVGRLSRMDALQGQAMSVEAKRRRQIELQKIEAALQRIQDGSYGACLRCGEDIAIGRIEADPAVTLCIRCASDAER